MAYAREEVLELFNFFFLTKIVVNLGCGLCLNAAKARVITVCIIRTSYTSARAAGIVAHKRYME